MPISRGVNFVGGQVFVGSFDPGDPEASPLLVGDIQNIQSDVGHDPRGPDLPVSGEIRVRVEVTPERLQELREALQSVAEAMRISTLSMSEADVALREFRDELSDGLNDRLSMRETVGMDPEQIPNETLNRMMEEAIRVEDYECADRIKKALEYKQSIA